MPFQASSNYTTGQVANACGIDWKTPRKDGKPNGKPQGFRTALVVACLGSEFIPAALLP